MAIKTSGTLCASDIRTELGSSGQLCLGSSEARALAGKSSGQICFSDFYGKSSAPPFSIQFPVLFSPEFKFDGTSGPASGARLIFGSDGRMSTAFGYPVGNNTTATLSVLLSGGWNSPYIFGPTRYASDGTAFGVASIPNGTSFKSTFRMVDTDGAVMKARVNNGSSSILNQNLSFNGSTSATTTFNGNDIIIDFLYLGPLYCLVNGTITIAGVSVNYWVGLFASSYDLFDPGATAYPQTY